MKVVISVIRSSDKPKLAEYITPLKVFLYTINIKRPRAKARASAITISSGENDTTFSRKLDLKISLKVMIYSPYVFIVL